MTLKTWIILGVIEQIVVFAYILPTHGYWFSFFGLTALLTLISSASDEDDLQESELIDDEGKK